MNLEKLKPWNWFKHEENQPRGGQLPVTRRDASRPDVGPGSLAGLHRELDRWIDDRFRAFGLPSMGGLFDAESGLPSFGGFDQPRIDVSGDANAYQVSLDVPGVKESDLTLEVSGDMLTIRGQTESRDENQDRHYYRIERRYGAFQRTLSLPDDADADEIEARLDKGVLRLTIPRRETTGDVRRIPIGS